MVFGGRGGGQTGQASFQVPVDESLETAFADFERHVGRKTWDKAFQSLMDLPAEKQAGMLPGKDGYLISARARIWQALADLPPEGREAFRIFYDARAQKLYDELTAKSDRPAKDVQTAAEQLFDRYFLTGVGDNAADLLAEMYFEQGRFDDAADCWSAVIDYHPNSELPEARLHVKRALALALAGRQSDFAAAQREIAQRFAGQMVKLGGRELDAAAAVSDVTIPGATAASASTLPTGAPNAGVEPAWQVEFLSHTGREQLLNAVRNNWYRSGIETYVPTTATDGNKLYCNWLGLCFAIDLENGKLLWRSEKFSQMAQRLPQMQQQPHNFNGFSITVVGDAVLAVAVPPDQLQQWQAQCRLTCYDAATGAVRWTSQNVPSIAGASFTGSPLVDGDEVLVAAYNGQQSPELTIRRLSLKTGEQAWSQTIGTVQPKNNRYGYQTMPTPKLSLRGSRLLILPNSGALVDFDLKAQKVNSVYRFGKPQMPQQQEWYYYQMPLDESSILHTQGVLTEFDGLMYFKEAKDKQLYAVDPATRKVAWKRPIKDSAQLVGVDQENCYLLSRELECIDRATQKLRWSIELPISGGGLSLAPTTAGLLVFTSRGLFEVNRSDGSILRIFRGHDLGSSGGAIQTIGDRAICVSNRAVTMYALRGNSE